MRFALTDEQLMLRDALRGALARELPPARVRACLERRDRAPMHALAAAQGWTGIGIPEHAGGQGGGVVEQALLAEELGHAGAPSSALIAGALAARVLAGGGRSARDLLASLAAGERIVVLAADAGSDAAGSADTAGDRASGSVANVLAAPEAEIAVVTGGNSALGVDLADGGCTVRERALTDPGRSIGDLELDDVPGVPLAGVAGPGDAALLGATLIAAEAVGAAARLLDMTVEYASQREQFGVPIGSFQAVGHMAADMLVEVETARSAVYHAAWALGAGDPGAATAVHTAKSYAVPAAASVADKALALHGAVGFTWEHDLHLYLKRTHTALALFGSASAHRERLAASLDLTASERVRLAKAT